MIVHEKKIGKANLKNLFIILEHNSAKSCILVFVAKYPLMTKNRCNQHPSSIKNDSGDLLIASIKCIEGQND